MKKAFVVAPAAVVAALSLAQRSDGAEPDDVADRSTPVGSSALVKPIMDRFAQRDGHSAQRALRVLDGTGDRARGGGPNSPADIYWSQEPGTLGLVGARGLLARLPQATVGKVPSRFYDAQPSLGRHEWALARARVQHERAAENDLPASVWGLTGFPLEGQDRPRAHERVVPGVPRRHDPPRRRGSCSHLARAACEENDVRFYPNNTTVVQAVGRGDVEVGLVNHYYLYNLLASTPGPSGPQPLVPRRRPRQPRARRGRRHRCVDAEGRSGAALRRLPAVEVRPAHDRPWPRRSRVSARQGRSAATRACAR